MRVPEVRFYDLRMPAAQRSIGLAWNKISEHRELIARLFKTITAVVHQP
jgi:hypothetical protein